MVAVSLVSPVGLPVRRVVDAADVDELLEAQRGIVAQALAHCDEMLGIGLAHHLALNPVGRLAHPGDLRREGAAKARAKLGSRSGPGIGHRGGG